MPLAIGVMGAVEKMFVAAKGGGAEKREAYITGLMAALGVTEATMDKDIINDEQFKELAGKLADNIVAINNFIRDHKSKEAK